jgi:hypothetical protein
MRLNLILPKVEPIEFEYPKKCPQKGCQVMRFIPRQEVSKKIVDAQHAEVTAWRCECGMAKNNTLSAPIPLEQIKSLSRDLGGTVNDVMFVAVTGGLRRYLEANGETIDFLDIRAVVPVNLRSNGDFENLGNQVGRVSCLYPSDNKTRSIATRL